MAVCARQRQQQQHSALGCPLPQRLPMLVAAVVLALLALPAADSYIYRTSFESLRSEGAQSRGQKITFMSSTFGFLDDATFTLSITCPNIVLGDLELLALSLKRLRQYQSEDKAPCTRSSGAALILPLGNFTANVSTGIDIDYVGRIGPNQILSEGFYGFVVRECPPFPNASSLLPTGTCDLEFVTLNPGGEHLSSDEIKIPGIYYTLMFVWTAVLGLWLLNWLRWRRFSNRLHDVLIIPPLLKLIELVLQWRRWSLLSRDGEATSSVENAYHTVDNLENAFFFAMYMVLAQGWCIIRPRIDRENKIVIFLAPAVLFAASMSMEYVHRYFLGLAIVAAIVIVVHVLKHSGMNLHLLHNYMVEFLVQHRVDEMEFIRVLSPLLHKRLLIKGSRVLFILYALVWCILGITSSFMEENQWVSTLVFEILEGANYLLVLYLFRLRDFTAFIPRRPPSADEHPGQPKYWLVLGPGLDPSVGVTVGEKSFSDFTKSLREYEQYRHEQNEANANEHDNNDADRGNDSDGASESEAVTSDSESEETAFVYGDGSPGDGFDPDDAQNVRLHVLQVRQSDAHCSSDSDSEL